MHNTRASIKQEYSNKLAIINQADQWQISMTPSPQKIKKKLYKELSSLTSSSINALVAEKAKCSSETVRQFFKEPNRVNDKVEKAAFELLSELREKQELKMKQLEA